MANRGNSDNTNKGIRNRRTRGSDSRQKCLTDDVFKAAESSIIKATAEMVGNPKLKDRTMINISNIGKVYNGAWWTKTVEHTIDERGYRCKASLVRNTLNEKQGGSEPPSNKAKLPPKSKDRKSKKSKTKVKNKTKTVVRGKYV